MYWHGNAAKVEVVSRLVEAVKARAGTGAGPAQVFDFGCGAGGDWPRILAEVTGIDLVGYEPDQATADEARRRLEGTGAVIHSGPTPAGIDLAADYIVSFSVFEHVYDRAGYLATAKRLLGPEGTFFLNYDDGHFRVEPDLNRPSSWPADLRRFAHNVLAPTLARAGRAARYQHRVPRDEADALVGAAGFACREVFYSNLDAMKALYKTVPESRRDAFCELWVDVERRLNEGFTVHGTWDRGDDVNLWQRMASRTLVLVHGAASR